MVRAELRVQLLLSEVYFLLAVVGQVAAGLGLAEHLQVLTPAGVTAETVAAVLLEVAAGPQVTRATVVTVAVLLAQAVVAEAVGLVASLHPSWGLVAVSVFWAKVLTVLEVPALVWKVAGVKAALAVPTAVGIPAPAEVTVAGAAVPLMTIQATAVTALSV